MPVTVLPTQVMILRPGQKPCHQGAIEVVAQTTTSKHIITGGADGYIRLWDLGRLNEAEADDDAHHACIDPVDELLLHDGALVKAVLQSSDNTWMVLDDSGRLHAKSRAHKLHTCVAVPCKRCTIVCTAS